MRSRYTECLKADVFDLPCLRREKGDSEEDLAVRNVVDALSPFLGPLDLLTGSQQRKSAQVSSRRWYSCVFMGSTALIKGQRV